MKLEDLKKNLELVKEDLYRILKKSGYLEDGDLGSVRYDSNDKENAFWVHEAGDIFSKLCQAYRNMEYLDLPVLYEGKLHKHKNGRYWLGDYEFTCGSALEVLLWDDWEERYKWVYSSIEHNGKDYYLVRGGGVAMEGLVARKRG